MFAAAAVAAAAALTAISTTSAHPSSNNQTQLHHNNQQQQQQPGSATQRPPNYISWHQYAIERRNSLQRRKIEITKRLEKATSANNPNSNNNKSKVNLVSLEKETGAFKSRATSTISTNNGAVKTLKMTPTIIGIENGSSTERIKKILNQKENIKLSSEICNEFIKIHKMHQNDVSALDELKALEIDPNNPTYSNFANLLNKLQAKDPEIKHGFDLAEISEVLLEYLQVHQAQNHGVLNMDNMESFGEFMTQNLEMKRLNNSRSTASFAVSKFQSVGKHLMNETNRKQEADLNYALHHRWDPKWLKTIRKTLCIPFTFVTLIFLLLSNLSSNWIKLDDNQRAGLWSVCNKSVKIDNNNDFENYIIINNENNTESPLSQQITLTTKINRGPKLFTSVNEYEDCYSKFILKEDAHLAVLALSLVALLFHTIGLVLMFVGFTYSSSSRTLYFHHSAGECLITSALVNGVDLLAFSYLVSSQIELSFKYGYCFYISLITSILTFFYSWFLYMDDVINEFRLWKLRVDIMNKRRSKNYLPT